METSGYTIRLTGLSGEVGRERLQREGGGATLQLRLGGGGGRGGEGGSTIPRPLALTTTAVARGLRGRSEKQRPSDATRPVLQVGGRPGARRQLGALQRFIEAVAFLLESPLVRTLHVSV